MNKFKYILMFILTVGLCTAFTSCKDNPNDFNGDSNYNQQFSPVTLTASPADTYVELSKFYIPGATGYIAEISTEDDFSDNVLTYEIGKIGSDETFTTPEDLKPETNYYLRIKAISTGKQDSEWLVYAKSQEDAEPIHYFTTKKSGEGPEPENE